MSHDRHQARDQSPYHIYPRRVAYHETDAMGVLHHSNHVRIFEEARVAMLRDREWMAVHKPQGEYVFAVTEQSARYWKPAYFDDALEVWTQVRLQGARIYFQYALFSPVSRQMIADGRTLLVAIDANFRVARLPNWFVDAISAQAWDENWPPSPS